MQDNTRTHWSCAGAEGAHLGPHHAHVCDLRGPLTRQQHIGTFQVAVQQTWAPAQGRGVENCERG